MTTAHILLATPQTDARLSQEQGELGAKARTEGLPRRACPHDPQSLIATWWFAGYDRALLGALPTHHETHPLPATSS